jgi:hypothetical protein
VGFHPTLAETSHTATHISASHLITMARVRRDASLMGQKRVLPPIPHSLDGAKKLGLDWERVEDNLAYTPHHKWTAVELTKTLRLRRQELQEAEEAGRMSKATKLRREINQLLEVDLALTHSTCPTCFRYLHRCKCPSDPTVSRSTNRRRKMKSEAASQHILDSLAIAEEARLQAIKDARLARKLEKRRS